jgi:hypothetical protein
VAKTPNGYQIDQHVPFQGLAKYFPKWDFWSATIPSGSPGFTQSKDCLIAIYDLAATNQGCQMVNFQTKNPNLGQFGRALNWKMLV